MRVTLMTSELVPTSDRLIDQYQEFIDGPKEVHKGPVRLEVTLWNEDSFLKLKEYLDKLKGLIPLDEVKKKVLNTNKVNPYKEVFQAIKAKTHIEDIIEYLNEINFRFISGQLIAEMVEDKRLQADILKDINPEYQYMVRVLRFAKDPANDKFDFTLMIGIKFVGAVSEKVPVIFNGNLKATLRRPWKNAGAVNMKKKKLPMVFPDFMTIEERKRWRYIRRKVELKRTVSEKENKFYERYRLDIKNLNNNINGHAL